MATRTAPPASVRPPRSRLRPDAATVWLALHTSRARPGLRLAVNVLFALAALAALGVLFVQEVDLLPTLFVAASLLYLVAPVSIVRHIVDLHGGTVAAASDGPGHGTTITIRLPATRPGASASSCQ